MHSSIEKAMECLAEKITTRSLPDEALKFTQAALNLAHTLTILDNLKPRGKQKIPLGT